MPHVAGSERVPGCGKQPRIESSFHPDPVSQSTVLWYSLPSYVGPRGDGEVSVMRHEDANSKKTP
eukprot:6289989-Prorocentrum_lima.AAC.1